MGAGETERDEPFSAALGRLVRRSRVHSALNLKFVKQRPAPSHSLVASLVRVKAYNGAERAVIAPTSHRSRSVRTLFEVSFKALARAPFVLRGSANSPLDERPSGSRPRNYAELLHQSAISHVTKQNGDCPPRRRYDRCDIPSRHGALAKRFQDLRHTSHHRPTTRFRPRCAP